MGQVSFEQIEGIVSASGSSKSGVGFFSLKNDGDEAIVRFMHDTTDSFDIMAVHPVTVDGKFRKVNCIRDAKDPLEKCPLCNNGAKLEHKIYIHLIQYTKDENGGIVATPKIWERSLTYANQLATLLNEYGPLSDCVFKVKRFGAPRSMDTKYQIMFASPQVYRPELYPKVDNAFDGFSPIGSAVMDKTAEELTKYIMTGNFGNESNSPAQPNFVPPATEAPAFSAGAKAPWETSAPISRPVRTY